MRESQSKPENDPEREAWLKQFSGLPETSSDEDLHTGRIVIEKFKEPHANPMTVEGSINAMGEMARESKRQLVDDEDHYTWRHRFTGGGAFFLVAIPLVFALIGGLVGIFELLMLFFD